MLGKSTQDLLKKEYLEPFHKEPMNPKRETYQLSDCSDVLQIRPEVSNEGKLSLYFSGEGCQLSLSSASLMCRLLEGFTPQDAQQQIQRVKTSLFQGSPMEMTEELSFLSVFYTKPNRRNCVALAWEGLEKELLKLSSQEE
jgi:nitrogen fixation NifU-like protein